MTLGPQKPHCVGFGVGLRFSRGLRFSWGPTGLLTLTLTLQGNLGLPGGRPGESHRGAGGEAVLSDLEPGGPSSGKRDHARMPVA